MQFSTMAGTAVGMAVGAAAVCLATQDQRMMRKTVHKLAKGAEKTLADLDKAVQHTVHKVIWFPACARGWRHRCRPVCWSGRG